jgi:hypothetical protein
MGAFITEDDGRKDWTHHSLPSSSGDGSGDEDCLWERAKGEKRRHGLEETRGGAAGPESNKGGGRVTREEKYYGGRC